MCDILKNQQLVLFWVFLGFFLIIGVISLLSIIGVLTIEERFRKWAITGFIVPVVGVIIAMAKIFLTPVDSGIQSDLHVTIENTVSLPKMKEATYEYSRQTEKPESATLNPGPGSLEIVVPYKANYIASHDQLIILKTRDYEGKEWYAGVYPKQIKTTLIPQEKSDNHASNSSSYFAFSLIKNAFAQTCQATVTQVKFSNWTRSTGESYGGRDYFKWRVFVDEDVGILDCIDEVQYELHPTFPNPLQIRRERSNNFAVEMSGWGEFDIKITVKLSNGTILPVQSYHLDFNKPWPQ